MDQNVKFGPTLVFQNDFRHTGTQPPTGHSSSNNHHPAQNARNTVSLLFEHRRAALKFLFPFPLLLNILLKKIFQQATFISLDPTIKVTKIHHIARLPS